MTETSRFRCFACNADISEETVKERMKAPPGACDVCGSPVLAETVPGAAAELAREVGETVRKIELSMGVPRRYLGRGHSL